VNFFKERIMNATMKANTQRGLALSTLLVWSFLLVILAITGMKIVPAYVENRTIQGVLNDIAHAPEMQDAQPHDIQNSFDKHAMIDNISVVGSNDLIIDKRPTGLVLSVRYQVKIPLFSNISLLIDFDTSSSHPR
jgi:hypothetical protein